ncbi:MULTISPECIES: outer membrane beta-barrel protein [unclassified Roseitalea]|uniref:outer membrane protein n=1 Tax=unclassified Roseitalea TaxID=2639107 RepID=UPI00273FAF5D|nr:MULTISPECIES: outer membrane beta-barrel protein [unclassified Roseitalea]
MDLKKLKLGTVIACLLMATPMLASAAEDSAMSMGGVQSGSWSGFYLGGHVGYATGEVRWYNPRIDAVNSDSNESAVFGVQIGHDFSIGGLVAGINAGFANTLGGSGEILCGAARGVASPNPNGRMCDREIADVFTIGGRLGVPFSDRLLGYASAGYANGRLETHAWPQADGRDGPKGRRSSARHDGFYVGLGGEVALTERVATSLEWRYYEFAPADQVKIQNDGGMPPNPIREDVRGRANTINLGLVFRF